MERVRRAIVRGMDSRRRRRSSCTLGSVRIARVVALGSALAGLAACEPTPRARDAGATDAVAFDHDCDHDGDGYVSLACGGDDCDDGEATRNPGAREICDDHDQDCLIPTFGDRDADADGYVDRRCQQVEFGPGNTRGSDCDDAAPGTHPFAVELCDGVDQDCDGMIDDGAMRALYVDLDGDGFAGTARPASCDTVSAALTDCDDTDPRVHPGAVDAAPSGCDGRDDDCDGVVDDDCACAPPATEACGPLDPADPSGSTFLTLGACRTGGQSCGATRWEPCEGAVYPRAEQCTGSGPAIDEDCDGLVDETGPLGPCGCGTYTGGWAPTTVTVRAGAPTLALGLVLTLVEGAAATSSAPARATVDLSCAATSGALGTASVDTDTPYYDVLIAPGVCATRIALVEADATHAVLTFGWEVCG